MNEEPIENNTEFYHTDIFGAVVDIDRALDDEEKDFIGKKPLPDFNVFSFTDALADKNKKVAWILFQKGLMGGLSAEELFFKATWIVRTMLIASKTNDYSETEMKEYPYKKAKQALKNWKPGELEALSEKLVVGYHEARRGNGEVETMLERVILGL
jgi:DNA polymerase III gamma/tau subunit